MHHGQTRGKRKPRKVCKKHVKFRKSGGKFAKVGGNNNFCEIGGNVLKQKRSSEILADEYLKFCSGKVQLGTFSTESDNFFENRGKSETREEMHHCLRGMDALAGLMIKSHCQWERDW